eukprot:CAMPEP_0169428202 /NCGR_PEP_ID=MMETSP1042-20121227/1200_1 /TAXON_ID=464988 /ORGANISM="Hemiselmis andersenii, Strain CCMP1180" /LENGTH=62 /DNA_ID=CAMNT_0009538355 /DNA_START=413 /DNA_END=597 /DNA_ORIENTATION=+
MQASFSLESSAHSVHAIPLARRHMMLALWVKIPSLRSSVVIFEGSSLALFFLFFLPTSISLS